MRVEGLLDLTGVGGVANQIIMASAHFRPEGIPVLLGVAGDCEGPRFAAEEAFGGGVQKVGKVEAWKEGRGVGLWRPSMPGAGGLVANPIKQSILGNRPRGRVSSSWYGV